MVAEMQPNIRNACDVNDSYRVGRRTTVTYQCLGATFLIRIVLACIVEGCNAIAACGITDNGV